MGDKTQWIMLCIYWGRLPQIICFTLSFKCFSSDPDNYSNVGTGKLLQFSHPPRTGPGLLTLLFFSTSSFIPPSFVVLCILFHWSGTPVSSQLVDCKHFCVWRCISDVSKERDVLHLHLPLCHVVHLNILTIINKTAVNIHVHIFGETFFLHIVRWPWVLDLKQDSSKWRKGKCIQCSLTAWRQQCLNGN